MAGVKLTSEQLELASVLTTLNRGFVINLVSGMTQRQAYLEAGGTAKTEAAQDANASRMLSDARVKAFYDSLMASAASAAVMTREEALLRLSKAGRITITDIADFRESIVGEDENGDPVMHTVWSIKNSEDMTPEAASAIKSVTSTKMGPKLEMHDPQAAIKQLADMQGWNAASKHDLSSSDGTMTPKGFNDFYAATPKEED